MPCTVEMSLWGGAECARAMIYYMYESASHEWGQIEGGGPGWVGTGPLGTGMLVTLALLLWQVCRCRCARLPSPASAFSQLEVQ